MSQRHNTLNHVDTRSQELLLMFRNGNIVISVTRGVSEAADLMQFFTGSAVFDERHERRMISLS